MRSAQRLAGVGSPSRGVARPEREVAERARIERKLMRKKKRAEEVEGWASSTDLLGEGGDEVCSAGRGGGGA